MLDEHPLEDVVNRLRLGNRAETSDLPTSIAELDGYVLMKTLYQDVRRCRETLFSDAARFRDHYNRRMLVRASMAALEAGVWATKQDALAHHALLSAHPGPGVSFNEAELAFLEDRYYDLDERGDVILRGNAKISLERNIRFTFKAYAKIFCIDYELDLGGDGWRCLKEAVKVRDRITHPKSAAQMEVSDAEVHAVLEAPAWFHRNQFALRRVWLEAWARYQELKSFGQVKTDLSEAVRLNTQGQATQADGQPATADTSTAQEAAEK